MFLPFRLRAVEDVLRGSSSSRPLCWGVGNVYRQFSVALESLIDQYWGCCSDRSIKC